MSTKSKVKSETEMLREEVERLKKENETLQKQSTTEITWKVSEKGALSIYGLQRFPVTLYKKQWEKIFEKHEEITIVNPSTTTFISDYPFIQQLNTLRITIPTSLAVSLGIIVDIFGEDEYQFNSAPLSRSVEQSKNTLNS